MNTHNQKYFLSDFSEPHIDVLQMHHTKILTNEIALNENRKSITHVVLPGSRAASAPGNIEMFWVYGEKYSEQISLGLKSVVSPEAQIEWKVSEDVLMKSSGKRASIYYIYYPKDGPKQVIGNTPDAKSAKSFDVNIIRAHLYDIYVTGASDHHQSGKSAYVYTLTHLDDEKRKWRSITRGGCSHLAISDKGTLWGWGYNDTGTLGTGTKTEAQVPTLCNFSHIDVNSLNIVQASTAFYYSVALDAEGYLYGTGHHSKGCLGDDKTDLITYNFERIGEHKYKYISANNLFNEEFRGYTTFAIGKDDHKLYRCGWSEIKCNVHLSSIENFPAIMRMTQVDDDVLSEHKWSSVVHNKYMGAAINEEENVYVWGCSWQGCLGDGKTNEVYTSPHKLDFNGQNPKIKKVVLGGNHSLALDTEGNVWGWGRNEVMCLAQATDTYYKPIKINVAGKVCIDIATDRYHSAVVTEDGKLYAWGHHIYGALGLGNDDHILATPTHVPFDEKIDVIEIGYWSLFALSTGESIADSK